MSSSRWRALEPKVPLLAIALDSRLRAWVYEIDQHQQGPPSVSLRLGEQGRHFACGLPLFRHDADADEEHRVVGLPGDVDLLHDACTGRVRHLLSADLKRANGVVYHQVLVP